MMKTVTLTQEEYDQRLKFCYGNTDILEKDLKSQMQNYSTCKDYNRECYERYTKAKMMLEKLQVSKYNSKSIVLQGKGVDRYIDYIEWENGEPLNESEMDDLLHNQELHSLLIEQYFTRS